MSDTKDTAADAAAPKKKGKLKKLLVPVIGAVVLLGGGAAAGVYAAGSGLIGGAAATPHEDPNKPHLVPKSEQKRGGDAGGGEHGGGESGGGSGEHASGEGGEKFASNYYAMEKEFTANLQDSPHFIQVGIAVSSPYDDKVINNIKTNDIAIRSAVLLTLGDTTEDQVFSSDGKKALQKRLVASINQVLREKEGFGGVGNVYFTNFVVQ